MAGDAGVTVTVNELAIVTTIVLGKAGQPSELVSFTVYVVVTVGFTTTVAPVVGTMAVLGVHVYEPAPAVLLAVMLLLAPGHMVTATGAILNVGVGLTTTGIVADGPAQTPSVAKTVYVPVAAVVAAVIVGF